MVSREERDEVEDFVSQVLDLLTIRQHLRTATAAEETPTQELVLLNVIDRNLLRAARNSAGAPWRKAWKHWLAVHDRATFEVLKTLVQEWKRVGTWSSVTPSIIESATRLLSVSRSGLQRYFSPGDVVMDDDADTMPTGVAEAAKWIMAKAKRLNERTVGKHLGHWRLRSEKEVRRKVKGRR